MNEIEPQAKKKSWLDPEAPIGGLAMFVASATTAVLLFAWWGLQRLGHCGIDAGGGPPPPPQPSSFSMNDLLYAVIGGAVVVLPVLLARASTASDSSLRVTAMRVMLAALGVIGFVTLRHVAGGVDYWPQSC